MYDTIHKSDLHSMMRIMATRHSVRRYRSEGITRELVNELLGCAINAPSAHNRQPWRFFVIDVPVEKLRRAEAMGSRLRADRLRDGDPPDAIEKDVAHSFERISSAPAAILVANTMVDMDIYQFGRCRDAEYVMAIQSTAMAVQNLLPAAHAAGLGACWICAPLFCPDTVRGALRLPPDWRAQAIITLGYPASAGKPRFRRPLADVVRFVEQR